MKLNPLSALICPPSILEGLVSEHATDFLNQCSKLEVVMFLGGPLAPATGDFLTKICDVGPSMGSTEAGMLPCLIPKRENWQWFEWHPLLMNERMEPLELGGELFELVVRRKDELAPYQPIFMTYPEINEWRTRDLFRKHPNKYLWTFQGRKDDVIVLSNGEKFNPVTTELIVSGHPLVAGALVVGSGRELCGLLLESRDNKAVELVEAVWPAVLDANKIAPGHGKIMRNMIRVLSPEQRFIRAPKGTIIRSLSTVNLEAVIMDLYEYTTTVPSSPSVSNTTLSEETILWHLRQAVASQLGRIPADEEDLFASAFDSLQATYLAGTLSKDFSGQLKSEKVSPKLIYENPSMMMMTHALISLLRSTETAKIDADAMIPNTATRSEPGNVSSIIQIKRMQSLVTRFSESFPKAAKTTLPRNNKLLNILITGTTGFLGSHLLRVLLKDPSVGKIVCFNRSDSGESAFRRHCTEDLHRIVFVKVAFGTDEFGLPHDIFQDLTETIDIIIHSAWKVDFNHPLASYEAQIRDLRKLVDWTITSPRRPLLIFMSSIASVAQWSSVYGDAKVSEDLDLNQDYRVASTLGYGQSKHVAERLLYLGSQAGARTAVLRIGQIAGPVWEHIEPVWNAHEWFPSMIKSSISLGMAPDSLGALSWVDWFPVDSLARTIQELTISLSNASSEQFHVFNLVNPRGTPYKDLVGPLKDRLDLKIVSYKRWMDAIKDIDGSIPQNLRDFPSLKLLDFMESLSTASPLDMETGLVQACSRTMKDLRALSALDMDCWLTQWGF